MHRYFTRILPLAFCATAAFGGENWPQWRGPHGDGTSREKNLPTEWNIEKNVLWRTPLPSWSGATPVVWEDRVFVTSPSDPAQGAGEVGRALRRRGGGGRSDPGGRDLQLICLNAPDGKVLWQRKLDDGNQLRGKQNMSSPSPVTDGKHVWALTGTGVLAAFDMGGAEVWRHDLIGEFGEFGINWGYASSPVLHGGQIIVQVLRGMDTDLPGYIAAFDAVSGKLAWRVERKTDASRECPDAYTTPVLVSSAGRAELVVSGADYVTGHDPRDGKELWRAAGLNPDGNGNVRVVASPVVVEEVVFCPSRRRPLLALRTGGTGDVTDSHLVWKLDERWGPDVPTPTTDGRYLYLVEDKGLVSCLDIRTGAVVWGPERTTIGTVSASPLLADGKLYVTNESGVTSVLAAGAKFQVLATNDLNDDYTISSIAASRGRLYIRTSDALYCVGQSSE